jgi:hypothetical protein
MNEPITCPNCGKIHGYKLMSVNAVVQSCDCIDPIERRFRAIEFELERLARRKEED